MRSDKELRRRFKEEEKRREGRELREQEYDARDLDDGTHHFSHRRKSGLKEDSDGAYYHQGIVDTEHNIVRVGSSYISVKVSLLLLLLPFFVIKK